MRSEPSPDRAGDDLSVARHGSRLPSVCVCILNWNSHEDTLRCIQSLSLQDYPDIRIVVVDNGSLSASVAALDAAVLPVELIRCKDNLGFAGGTNLGIKFALEHGADYVWLLNADATVQVSALSRLVEAGQRQPAAAILGPVIYCSTAPEQIQSSGMRVDMNRGVIEYFEDLRSSLDCEAEFPLQFCLWGTALLIRCSAVRQIGFLDERFFAYYEDVDYCLRAGGFGFRTILVPDAGVLHGPPRTGEHLDTAPLHRVFYMTRNSILFWRKHARGMKRLKFVYWSVASALKAIAHLDQNTPAAVVCLDGVWCGLVGKTGGWTKENCRLHSPRFVKRLLLVLARSRAVLPAEIL